MSAETLLSRMSEPVVVAPSGKHTATIIFLHGLGDTGHGWASTMASIRSGQGLTYMCILYSFNHNL